MKTTYVSTFALANANRRAVMDQQAELNLRQQELTTGRVADAGLALGARTRQSVALRQEHASLQALIDSNAIATSRIDATQAALTKIAADAGSFLGVLIDAKGDASHAAVAQTNAGEKIASLIGELNATHAGEHIFAGINSGVAPINDYFAPGSAARQAIDDAFLARFGFTQDDPAVASISGADMQDFLDTEFSALFDSGAWSTNWSSASDETIRGRISTGAVVATGVSANQPAIQKLAMAYAMVSDLGLTKLSTDAYGALIGKAVSVMGEATQGITEMQAHLGATQEAVTGAGERLSIQKDVLAKHIGSLEGVDPYEASTRVTTLLTQIETSYAMTARIQQLSLLDYL